MYGGRRVVLVAIGPTSEESGNQPVMPTDEHFTVSILYMYQVQPCTGTGTYSY